MDKKQREREILPLVYGDENHAEILESEQPDCLIRRTGADVVFGVEVTEILLCPQVYKVEIMERASRCVGSRINTASQSRRDRLKLPCNL